MSNEDDRDEWASRLRAKLEPDRIRATLAFAGLFQLVHEMVKRTVLEDVKGFYGHSPLTKGDWAWGDEQYRKEVLARAPGNDFRASLLWLVDSGALTTMQMHRLDEVYQHRHALAHELARFVIDVDKNTDVALLVDAVSILRGVSRFWTQVEIDLGSFEAHGDVDVDRVQPGTMLVLDMCLEAFLEAWGDVPSA